VDVEEREDDDDEEQEEEQMEANMYRYTMSSGLTATNR